MACNMELVLPNSRRFESHDGKMTFECSGMRCQEHDEHMVDLSLAVAGQSGGATVSAPVWDSETLRTIATLCARAAEWLEAHGR